MRYPGGKSVSGVYQRLINQIPPHRVYIESHLGGGALLRLKKPAEINIGLDIDYAVLKKWTPPPDINLICTDAVQFLKHYPYKGDEFIYADPPYIRSARRSKRSIYRFEYTEDQHLELLKLLTTLPCRVMISGYSSTLYSTYLVQWRHISFETRNRAGGKATESIWMNYPEPEQLHDYRFLGNSFRERERIKRRIERWKERFRTMPQLERNALLLALSNDISNSEPGQKSDGLC